MSSNVCSRALRQFLAAASAAALLTLLAGPAATAATLDVSASCVLSAEGSSNFPFPLFDPSMGTLNSVTLSADETENGPDFVEIYQNNHSTSIISPATASQTINIQGAGGVLLTLYQSLTQTVDYTPQGTAVQFDLPMASAGPATFTDAADLAMFTGTGTFYLGGDGGTYGVSMVPSIIDVANIPQDELVQVNAIYDYTPNGAVPEPGSLALFAGAGISAAGLLARRLRR